MIAVEADMRAELSGVALRIVGCGNVLTCRLDADPRELFTALRRSRRLLGALRALVPLLVRSRLRLDVFVANVRIAHAGSGVDENGPARLLRLPYVHLGG